ncbi:hypothetical protein Tco_1244919 [Tanacetum coccineum]
MLHFSWSVSCDEFPSAGYCRFHTEDTDMVKLVVEIECFGKSFDEFDKETGSSDGLQPKPAGILVGSFI